MRQDAAELLEQPAKPDDDAAVAKTCATMGGYLQQSEEDELSEVDGEAGEDTVEGDKTAKALRELFISLTSMFSLSEDRSYTRMPDSITSNDQRH